MTLDPTELQQALASLDAWTLDGPARCINKAWTFDSFPTAVSFFVKLSELAERLDHHPEVLSSFTRMRVRLWTHDADGLTHQDFELAAEIDRLVKSEFSGRLA
jgi:4a-hydroxytetrahydrobiopterin dehydratase